MLCSFFFGNYDTIMLNFFYISHLLETWINNYFINNLSTWINNYSPAGWISFKVWMIGVKAGLSVAEILKSTPNTASPSFLLMASFRPLYSPLKWTRCSSMGYLGEYLSKLKIIFMYIIGYLVKCSFILDIIFMNYNHCTDCNNFFPLKVYLSFYIKNNIK